MHSFISSFPSPFLRRCRHDAVDPAQYRAVVEQLATAQAELAAAQAAARDAEAANGVAVASAERASQAALDALQVRGPT
jgi:hypothetical protein